MPADVFDQVAPTGDIFDALAPEKSHAEQEAFAVQRAKDMRAGAISPAWDTGEIGSVPGGFQPMQIPRVGFTPKPDDNEPIGRIFGIPEPMTDAITKGSARKAGAILVNAAAAAAEGTLHPATPAIIAAATVAPEVVIPALTASMAKSGSTNLAEGLVDLQQGRESEAMTKLGNAATELLFAAAPAAGAKGLAERTKPAVSPEAAALAPRTTAAVERVVAEAPKAEPLPIIETPKLTAAAPVEEEVPAAQPAEPAAKPSPEPPVAPAEVLSEDKFKLRQKAGQIDAEIQGETGTLTVRAPTSENPDGTHSVKELMVFVPPEILDPRAAPRQTVTLKEPIVGKTKGEARQKAFEQFTETLNKGEFIQEAVPAEAAKPVQEATSLAQFHDPISTGALLGAYQRAHARGEVGLEAQKTAWSLYAASKEPQGGIANLTDWLAKTKRIEEVMRPQTAPIPPRMLPGVGINSKDVAKQYGMPEDFYGTGDEQGHVSSKYRTPEYDAALEAESRTAHLQGINANTIRRLARERTEAAFKSVVDEARKSMPKAAPKEPTTQTETGWTVKVRYLGNPAGPLRGTDVLWQTDKPKAGDAGMGPFGRYQVVSVGRERPTRSVPRIETAPPEPSIGEGPGAAVPKPAKTLMDLPEEYFTPANLRKLRKDTLRRLGNSLGVEPTVGAISKKAAERFAEMPEGGGPVSMGAATPGEFAEQRPTAGTPAHQVETAPPQERPLGPVDPSTPSFANLAVEMLTGAPTGGAPSPYSIDTLIKGLAGHSAPKLTTLSRTAGEALVRYASSKIAAPFKAIWFSAKVLETGIDHRKYGAAIVEDNLRDIEQGFLRKMHEARDAGLDSLADEYAEKAANARSIVGGANSPFQTEAEYIDFFADRVTQETVRRHAQAWQEDIEAQFKAAQGIDPDVELPTRGLQTGARINLKVVFEGEESGRAVGTVRGGLTSSFKHKSPFGIEARGTGDVYEIDFVKLMENTYRRQLEIANQNAMNAMLVDQGLAKIAKPGERVDINGEPAVPFPLSRRLILTEGKTIPAGQNINVARSFADEYRMALSSDKPQEVPFLTPIANALNTVALWGLTDAGIHVSNLMTALFTRPGSPLLWDTLAKLTNRIDVPVVIARALIKSAADNRQQLARIAEIGALRADFRGTRGPLASFIKWADQTTRLMLHDTYKELVRNGIASESETAEREFVNQAGQYNKKLQGQFTVWLRDTGVGPFVTAGKTFNALGIRNLILSPGLEATSPMAAAALRVNQLAGWVGFATLVGTLNYLMTRNKGGYVMGRPGVPLGNIDTGLDNDKGQPLSIPLGDILGYKRALRVSGARRLVEGARYGLNLHESLDNAFADVFNSVVGPGAGPAVRFTTTAASGYPPAINVPRVSPAAGPQQSQFAVNVQTALREANPMVASIADIREGKPLSQAIQRQLPRFTLQASPPVERVEHLAERVEGARINEYADDLARRARRLPLNERVAFVQTEMKKAKLTDQEKQSVSRKIMPRIKYP